MKKILFIYGYGSSPDSTFCTLIREALPADEYTVLYPEYPQEDCAKAHAFLLEYVEKEQIDVVRAYVPSWTKCLICCHGYVQ